MKFEPQPAGRRIVDRMMQVSAIEALRVWISRIGSERVRSDAELSVGFVDRFNSNPLI